MKSLKKWEISLMVGVAAVILWCAATPRLEMQWWTTAFAPLCDGLLGTGGGEGLELHCWLWDMLRQYVF